jgi:hypothetical protein
VSKKTGALYIAANRFEYTKITLPLAHDRCTLDVSTFEIFDNASEPRTAEYLKWYSETQGVALHRSDRNVGLTGALDFWYHNCPAEYLTHVNNDWIVPPGWIKRCVEVLDAHEDVGICALNEFDPRQFNSVPHDFADKPSYLEVTVTGGAGVFRRRLFDMMGEMGEGGINAYYFWRKNAGTLGLQNVLLNPPLYFEHLDQSNHPMSLRNTKYKEYSVWVDDWRNHPEKHASMKGKPAPGDGE